MEVPPWRKRVFEPLRESRVAAALFCEPAIQVRNEMPLAGRVDIGPGGETEQVLGFDAVMMPALVVMTMRVAIAMRVTMSVPGLMRVRRRVRVFAAASGSVAMTVALMSMFV